jgi:HD-GYP domain-containing protein (c-di-GMP phosphodiesterase class II)
MLATVEPGEPRVAPADVMDGDALTRLAARLAEDPRMAATRLFRAHPLLLLARRDARTVVLAPAAVWDRARDALRPFTRGVAEGSALVVLLGRPRGADAFDATSRGLAAILPEEPAAEETIVALASAFDLLEARRRAESRGRWLNRYRYELGELIDCARALTTERDIDKLLDLVLVKARYLTGADAGSLYVVEGDGSDRQLRFKLSQNDSVPFDSREFTIPLSPRSIAGAAVLLGSPINIDDVYDLPAAAPYAFDRSFDEKTGYRTRSMLTVPLVSSEGEAIGVIQLINKKRDPERRLAGADEVEAEVVPFDDRSEELAWTLAAQAGVSLNNALLIEEIRRIFEGFVRASVEAIESRDPTTSGHSRRVAELTLGLAHALERTDTGPYREVAFTPQDLREIEYASLLHDFGKIGVREQVLVKAKKLHDPELAAVRSRIELAIRGAEADALARKLRLVEKGAPRAELEQVDAELAKRRHELLDAWKLVVAANEPTVLSGGDFRRIEELARETYVGLDGAVQPLLTAAEVTSLSVTRGSLTPAEFDEIRSHVVHTYNFLSRIPWGKSFRRVPLIAGAHHEWLDGSGYPNRLRGEEIPLQSKMMSVSDVFDALTASDRPYKKAVPLERALDILALEVKGHHLDGELVRVFVEARPWEHLRAKG